MNFHQKSSRQMPRHCTIFKLCKLKNGLLFFGAGLGLLVAYFIDANNPNVHENEAIYFSCIAIGGGLGLIASYAIEKKEIIDKRTDMD